MEEDCVSIENMIQKEIQTYMAFAVTSIDKNGVNSYKMNPLLFWDKFNHIYPLLSKICVIFLAPCAGSHPSESVFSTAGYVLSPRRSCTKPENVNTLLVGNSIEELIVKLKDNKSKLLTVFVWKCLTNFFYF